jgi:molybdenum cofactor cytidylyltransferase
MPRVDGPRVTALVLAAGSSTRMGRNKLLLGIGGESLVRRAARAALESGVDGVTVVLGHEADRVKAELAGLDCATVVNPDHASGQGASLRKGVASLSLAADAALVLLADMPFVTTAMIVAVLERHRETGAPLVISRYGGVQAPPTLYGRALFEELLGIPDERCGKQLVRRHESEAAVVEFSADALRDIDVADDYERARADLAGA